jgi:hypothetical protein
LRSKLVLNLVSSFVAISVADPLHFDADPACQFDAGQDPTFHVDADPDPDPSFQIKAQNLEKVLK